MGGLFSKPKAPKPAPIPVPPPPTPMADEDALRKKAKLGTMAARRKREKMGDTRMKTTMLSEAGEGYETMGA